MNFQDKQKDSVQSLLARLRAAQDGPLPSPAPHTGPDASGTSQTKTKTSRAQIQDHAGPSSRQLNDLLSSLGKTTTTPLDSMTNSNTNASIKADTETQSRTSRHLIAPFGPIASLPSNSTIPKPHPSIDTLEKEDHSELSFSKSLPLISTLLADDGFREEVRRMKVDQDTLERRLWAKGEKVKGEWEKGTRTDREIARITGKEISPTKKREWDKQLALNLMEFHRNTCLPSIDGLAARHRARLLEMGVPGLGGDLGDKAVRERVRRIMDLLEAGLEE